MAFSLIFLLKNIFLGLIISIITFILGKKYKFNISTIYLLCLSVFTPVFVIGFLFDETYMWDTIVYLRNINFIRDFNSELILPDNTDTKIFSWTYSLIPLPITDNTTNIGFFSKFLYILFFIYLIKSEVIKEKSFLFFLFLLWPSIILYSSVGLKETPTLILSFFIIKSLLDKNYLFMSISFILLYFLKDQNSYILAVVILSYLILFEMNFKKVDLLFIFGVLTLLTVFFLLDPIFDKLNFYRFNMFLENLTPPNEIVLLDYKSPFFIFDVSKYTINFIFAPLPHEINNSFRLVQFLENIIIFLILLFFIKKAYLIDKKKTIFWVISLLFACAVYGAITDNPGSISRWRFPFLANWILLFNIIMMNKNKIKNESF